MARAPTITVRLEGAEELRRRLMQVKAAARGDMLKQALMPAAELIRDAARERAPRDTGRLRESIIVRSRRVTPTGAELEVAATSGRAHLTERGTKVRRVKRARVLYSRKLGRFFGREVGPSPAKPFMRPAYNEQKQRAFQLAAETLRWLLERV